MKPLWPEWPRLLQKFSSSRRKLLLLDFDGTLAPIARVPRAVVLGAGVRQCLDRLAERPDYVLCLISGRSIPDLRNFIRDRRWVIVGNHGYEIEGHRLAAPARARQAYRTMPLIARLAEKLRMELGRVAGVLVENKGLTLSLHFRNVPAGLMPLVREVVRRERRHSARLPLVWRRGKMVWEARPRLPWSKGHAALYLRKCFRGSAIIAIGDDRTDEDMFRMLKGKAINVHVGRSKKSEADYYVGSQTEVQKFLEDLCR